MDTEFLESLTSMFLPFFQERQQVKGRHGKKKQLFWGMLKT